MNPSAKTQLDSIIRELNGIISELNNISYGIRRDFSGIGNERCATCVSNVVEQYKYVRNVLSNMNENDVTDEFLAASGGGGGGGFR